MKRWRLGVLCMVLLGWGVAAHAELPDSFESYVQGRALQTAIAAPALIGFSGPVGLRASADIEAGNTDTTGLDVPAATGAVPETETWALMLAGALAVGWMYTRRRH